MFSGFNRCFEMSWTESRRSSNNNYINTCCDYAFIIVESGKTHIIRNFDIELFFQ